MSIKRGPIEIIGREKIDELWGEGFTIALRQRYLDPTRIDPEIIPSDRAYQWVSQERDLKYYRDNSWADVPADRHPGVFAPWGYQGPATIGDLILVDKPKMEVEAFHKSVQDKAGQNAKDWMAKVTGEGITGSVNVIDERTAKLTEMTLNPDTNHAHHSHIPPDVVPHLGRVLRERDRMANEEFKKFLEQPQEQRDKEPFNLAASHVRCMPKAIETVRAQLKAEAETPEEPK